MQPTDTATHAAHLSNTYSFSSPLASDAVPSGLFSLVSSAASSSLDTYLPPQNWGAVPSDASRETCSDAAHALLYQPGRCLLRDGCLEVSVPGTFWATMQKRYLFLFTDVCVVAAVAEVDAATLDRDRSRDSSSCGDFSSSSPRPPPATHIGCGSTAAGVEARTGGAGKHVPDAQRYEVHNVLPLAVCRVLSTECTLPSSGSGQESCKFSLQSPAGECVYMYAYVCMLLHECFCMDV